MERRRVVGSGKSCSSSAQVDSTVAVEASDIMRSSRVGSLFRSTESPLDRRKKETLGDESKAPGCCLLWAGPKDE